jgi:hypothetical protein
MCLYYVPNANVSQSRIFCDRIDIIQLQFHVSYVICYMFDMYETQLNLIEEF